MLIPIYELLTVFKWCFLLLQADFS